MLAVSMVVGVWFLKPKNVTGLKENLMEKVFVTFKVNHKIPKTE